MKIKKNQNGFTLFEMLVSIFIIALISGLVIVNYNLGSKRSRLYLAADKVAADVRLAQNMSAAAAKFNGEVPAGGWGVYFSSASPGSYFIFADVGIPNGNKQYNSPTEKYSEEKLPAGVTISSISSGSSATATFEPPDPLIWINGTFPGSIKIGLTDGADHKYITVNVYGLVDVTDS